MANVIFIKEYQDHRGNLVALDQEIPFGIKRVYFIHSVPKDITRAGHSHKRNTQALIAVKGKCVVSIFNTPDLSEDFALDATTKCLILQPEDWHTIHSFSDDCVLMVLASEHYDREDYIDHL